ncbi:MAG: peptide-methionine (S)-S-oxide reductase MsrA [Acetobacteraceae bacterium]|nr:peptide-methionine (S)-S-oxide reductase MsrA [Acetobacteraceae bacterium]
MFHRSLHAALLAAAVAIPVAGLVLLDQPSRAADAAQAVPAPLVDTHPADAHAPQTAVLSGGCFWGVQGVFQHVRGVERVVAGYSGGTANTANYETVSDGGTGHAESVQITYDPAQISYGQILRIFFSVALDPTEVNRQGPDSGTQYRSEIFYATPEQEKVAHAYIAQLDQAHVFAQPIATRVDPLTGFYPAESYHQDYLTRHPNNPYIVINDLPKVRDLQRLFPSSYAEQPVLALRSGA